MSALLQLGGPRRADGVMYVSDGVLAPDHYRNGLGYEANGALSVDFGGTIDHYHQNLGFTAEGRIACAQNPPSHYGSGAAPFVGGKLAIANNINAIITHFTNGVAYSAEGRVCTVSNESPP